MKCPKCKGKITPAMQVCPFCGFPLKKAAQAKISLAVILTPLIIAIVGFFIYALVDAKMSPAESQKVGSNLYVFKGNIANVYYYTDGSNAVLIDAGDNTNGLIAALKGFSISPDSVKAVFLTHSDYDHTSGLSLFPSADIYISKDEEQMINGKSARFFGLFKNDPLPRAYKTMQDGETVYIGSVHRGDQVVTLGTLQVRAIVTPGHTLGAVCYLINDKYLFTGDTLSLEKDKVYHFSQFINMDTKTQIASIGKLVKSISNISFIGTGHSGWTTNTAHSFDEWIQ